MTVPVLRRRQRALRGYLTRFELVTPFGAQHSLGLDGMVRRIYEYQEEGWTIMNLISTIGAFVLGLSILLTIINVVQSLKKGAIAGPDPWKANTLEWFTSSPPPEHNFDAIPRMAILLAGREGVRMISRFGPGRIESVVLLSKHAAGEATEEKLPHVRVPTLVVGGELEFVLR